MKSLYQKAPQAKIDEEKAKLEKYQQMLAQVKRTFTGTYKVIYVKAAISQSLSCT